MGVCGCARAGLSKPTTRDIPADFSRDDRIAYETIATRASNEAVNLYTIVSLGSQAFVEMMEEYPMKLSTTPAPDFFRQRSSVDTGATTKE